MACLLIIIKTEMTELTELHHRNFMIRLLQLTEKITATEVHEML